MQTNDHSFIDLIEVSIGIKFDRPALQQHGARTRQGNDNSPSFRYTSCQPRNFDAAMTDDEDINENTTL